jgi:rhamnogalacturonyl hydrolase YesR
MLAMTVTSTLVSAQPKEFKNWPAGTSPQEVGKRVANRFVVTPHTNFGRKEAPSFITYPESVAWYGALTFAQLSGDKDLTERLIRRFDPLLVDDAKLVPEPKHVDLTVFGIVPLQIYIETKDQKYLDL